MEKTEAQKKKRRYNLHYKLRKRGIELVTAEKTFKVGYNDKTYKEDKTVKRWINELMNDYQYGLQFIIK